MPTLTLPSGRAIELRPLSGLDRMALRLERAGLETGRERLALSYATVGLMAGEGARPRFVGADLVAYGELVCATWEAQGEDPDELLDRVIDAAQPVLVPPGPTKEAVDAAGKDEQPPATGA